MRAISLWQPFASLCVVPNCEPCDSTGHIYWDVIGSSGDVESRGMECDQCATAPRFKTIETRHWPAPKALIGQRIAIHAAKRKMRQAELAAVFGEFGLARWLLDLPMGAVVGTAVLAACVPMVSPDDLPTDRHVAVMVSDDALSLYAWDTVSYEWTWALSLDAQRPYGLFEPGRYAWFLNDAEMFDEPITAVGHQGFWDWTPPVSPDLSTIIEDPLGGTTS